MATSATATATMAAAGFDKGSSGASSLQTPGSGGFPSELRSPLAASPGMMKQKNDDLKTPITPPSAYLDFLRNMTPTMMSPAPTSTSARFSFNGEKFPLLDKTSDAPSEKSSISPPTSQPTLSRNTSYDSNSSSGSNSTAQSIATNSTAAGVRPQRPESPRVTIPPSPFARPAPRSSRTPRRLTIPQSPLSGEALPSARSVASPYTSGPLCNTPWSASFSPREIDIETTGKPGKVTVKQIVTRTVTYCRTPLEAVPDGSLWKRRKVEHDATIKEGSEEPVTEEPPATIKEEVKEETPAEAIPANTTATTEAA